MTASPRFSLRRRAVLGLLLALAAAATFGLARIDAAAVEAIYSQGIFPPLAVLLSGAARLLPFSLAETSVALTLIAAAGLAVRGLTRALRRRATWRTTACAGAANLLLAAGLGFLVFEVSWGLHHARRPLAEHLAVEVAPPSLDDVLEAARRLAEQAARNRAELEGPGLVACDLRPLRRGTNERLDAAWARAAAEVPSLAGATPLVRFPLSSRLLTLAGLTGIYSPFTAEAHVNAELPTVLLPFVACHEVAHQRGFAREDEANFLGWYVTSLSGDAAFRYSGELVALDHLRLALLRSDPAAGVLLMESLAPLVRADLIEVHAFWQRQQHSRVARNVTRVVMRTNDLYLKGQGHVHGVASYGRMVDLLVAHLLSSDGAVGASAEGR